MITKSAPCNSCGRPHKLAGKTCPSCIESIVTAAAGGEQSYAEIGDDHNLSKNQIVGIVDRNRPSGFKAPRAPRINAKAKHMEKRRQREAEIEEAKAQAKAAAFNTEGDPHEASARQCKFIDGDPLGEWRYCKGRINRQSYCAYHWAETHQKGTDFRDYAEEEERDQGGGSEEDQIAAAAGATA
jgi:hypothetical protein|tara:strand:+ start:12328 stop:12879 length:552 start_codon:yes stop_codon:yes gene_type:complete